ncbi:MAG: bifunctional phosphoribosylaminoimidazolecarboxamide formyltransferase/IMP cyclohydrolase [Candidatus Eisenbacteria bacterium]|uniref:Bifunctional purine biosynthesis protein PurH n=1 Tax=Eiseniibacteriota bacterium TaxID=2212470 RepID=A0A956RPY6_UNCEI|nr:bifunctional phosphoribosylaminoimidazolecarboxamide formyltransferase/IMP cyclohydrolase [Candidatus Eisenbacteria bacterium]
MIPIRRALFSAYSKDGLIPLAQEVSRWGGEIVASGGTAQYLSEAGLDVVPVETLTGFGSLFGGRVKTLHPNVHGGILFRRDDPHDVEQARQAGIVPIDLVVVNLYPFEAALERGASASETIELIDIGGPAMVRAAAKNHASVVCVTLPDDYARVRTALAAGEGRISPLLSRELAAKAFSVTAHYDAAIAGYLSNGDKGEASAQLLPDLWELRAPRRQTLRYGENPSQQGGLYGTGKGFPFDVEQIHGKEISFNNYLDLGCGRDTIAEFGGDLCAVVIKHGIPCGVARGETPAEAYRRARAGDSLSAFGGVVVLNRIVDEETAELLNETFLEVVLAPGFSESSLSVLRKKKNRILLRCAQESLTKPAPDLRGRFLGSGFLLQSPLPVGCGESDWRTVTETPLGPAWREDLRFAWRVLKHVRSNGVLFARAGQTLGVGSGQCSRVDATEIAISKARREGHSLEGSVMVSDAFFPFPDSVEKAAEVGAVAVLQPGGSVKDEDVIAACNRLGVAMVLNGQRVFSHG